MLIITRASGGAVVNKAGKTRLKLDGFGGLEATRPRVAHTQHNNGAATRSRSKFNGESVCSGGGTMFRLSEAEILGIPQGTPPGRPVS